MPFPLAVELAASIQQSMAAAGAPGGSVTVNEVTFNPVQALLQVAAPFMIAEASTRLTTGTWALLHPGLSLPLPFTVSPVYPVLVGAELSAAAPVVLGRGAAWASSTGFVGPIGATVTQAMFQGAVTAFSSTTLLLVSATAGLFATARWGFQPGPGTGVDVVAQQIVAAWEQDPRLTTGGTQAQIRTRSARTFAAAAAAAVDAMTPSVLVTNPSSILPQLPGAVAADAVTTVA